MIEVEMKLPIEDKILTEKGLYNLGFKKGNLVRESDTYFNSKSYDLRNRDMALRIRKSENITTGKTVSMVTYKGPKLDSISMTRKELETEVKDAEVCQEILKGIGFEQLYPVRKLRKYYHLEQITACVDQVENLGDFLELEIIVSDEKDREDALKKIENILKRLGHSMVETTRKSYLFMLHEGGVQNELYR